MSSKDSNLMLKLMVPCTFFVVIFKVTAFRSCVAKSVAGLCVPLCPMP